MRDETELVARLEAARDEGLRLLRLLGRAGLAVAFGGGCLLLWWRYLAAFPELRVPAAIAGGLTAVAACAAGYAVAAFLRLRRRVARLVAELEARQDLAP